MKIISYNVNGIRAAITKGFLDWLQQANPDVICLQEIKATEDQIPVLEIQLACYPYQYYFSAQKKGYSGVAILTKIKPNNVAYGCRVSASLRSVWWKEVPAKPLRPVYLKYDHYTFRQPSEYILFNKSNGEIISKLGTFLYRTEKQNDKPFILTLENYNTLLLTNLSTNKSYQIHLPKGLLEKSLETSKYLFVEYLFEEGRLIKNDFYIKYNHRENIKDNWKATVLKFKLSAYGI